MSDSRFSGVKFLDGPATGIMLHLRHAPLLLRVTSNRLGIWDALDEPSDSPTVTEKIHVYYLVSRPEQMFIRSSDRKLNGRWMKADYAILEPQPDDRQTRENAAWAAWCDANGSRLVKELHLGFLFERKTMKKNRMVW